MSSPDKVFLHDRIKEISYDTGTGNFRLDGAIKGFAPFSNFYASGDAVFYAITDGTDWEVGSGQYIFDGSTKAIKRFSFNSSNSDSNVNFQAGVKEVFVSYPGKFSIFSANGMSTFNKPAASGLAFFASPHIVDYSSNLTWNTSNNKLGVTKSDPEYSIDVGGALSYSSARVSGVIVGESGIMFSGVSSSYASSYSGGRQLEPFMRNELDATTGSNAIFSLSGLVDQRILLDTQVKGSVFAGPVSGCGAGDCSPDYPTFRYLTLEDIPDLSTLYTQQYNASYSGDIAFYRDSGVVEYDHFLNWDKTNNYLGVNRCDPQYTLDVDGNTSISGELDVQEETFLHNNLNVSGNVVISGNLDVQGNLTYIDSSTVTIWDKQLELASMSGTALANDAAIDDGGLVIKSSDSDKKWTWRDVDDAWRTEQNVGISGTLKASGNSIFGNNLSITNALTASGAAEFHDTLKTSGDAIFYQDVLVNEDLKVSGTLSVSGSTIIDNIVNIYDNAYLHDNTFLKSNATISGNLDVSGVSFLNNELKTSGNVIFGKDLLVTNNMTTSGNAGISGNLDVNRDLFIYGGTYYDQDVTVSGNLYASGVSTFNEDVYFTANAPVVMSGNVGISGAATLNGTLDVSGKTALHDNLSVGGNVVVSGNLDVQGDLTYIDSSTVTIWDKQLELASMSGTALYADSALDDAGIVIKSTSSDKKWTWHDSNDSWRTDEGIGASGLLEVSGHATFGNDLLVTNNAIVKGDTYTVGDSTTSGTLNTSGNVFFNSDTYTVGNATTSGMFNASGVSIFNEDAYFTSNAPVVMSGTLGVSGAAQFDSTVDASGDVTLGNDLWVTNNATVSGTLGVSGIVSFDDTLHFRDDDIRIGLSAGLNYNSLAVEGYRPINIGKNAGNRGSGISTVNVGTDAGMQASGRAMTNVGVRAGYRAIDSLRTSTYGSHAGSLSSGCWYSLMGGYTAGYAAENCDYSTFLGPYAGSYAGGSGLGQGLSHTLAVGSGAGYYAKGKHNVMVGGDCGAFSSGTDNIFIGVRAGYHTSGNNNLEISTCCDTLMPSGTVTSNKLNLSETIVGDISTKRLAIGNVNATHLSPNSTLDIVPNGADVALLASGNINVSGLATLHGGLALKETTTPTALADHGKVYTKADNKLYFQDGGGTEHEIAFA